MNTENRIGVRVGILGLLLLAGLANQHLQAEQTNAPTSQEKVTLQVWGIPESTKHASQLGLQRVIDAFCKRHPNVILKPQGKLRYQERIAPVFADVPWVQTGTIRLLVTRELLYPLDKYYEKQLDISIPNGPNLNLTEYLSHIQKSPHYKTEIEPRIPLKLWNAIRRPCTYGEHCYFCKEWGIKPKNLHYHIWTVPQGTLGMVLRYRRDLFREAGLPDRAPRSMEEMLNWAKRLTKPEKKQYGLRVHKPTLAWNTSSILYAFGGDFTEEVSPWHWRLAFDSEQAVEAYTYVARMFFESYEMPDGKKTNGVITSDSKTTAAMMFGYIDDSYLIYRDPEIWGWGLVPKVPGGKHASELNTRMTGLSIRLLDNERLRDLAWEYAWFYMSNEAMKIRASTLVEEGVGQFAPPHLLRAINKKDLISEEALMQEKLWPEIVRNGVLEPYGPFMSPQVHSIASEAINEILANNEVKTAVKQGRLDTAREVIRSILHRHVAQANKQGS